MQNVFDSGKVPYEAAPIPQPRSLDKSIMFYLGVVKDVIIVLVVGIPMLFLKLLKNLLLSSEKNVAGQLALITGGANGIGREIALKLAEKKCNLAIADVDCEAGKETVKDCLALGVKAKFFEADVGDSDQVISLRKTIETEMGNVDILVNNAGLMPILSLREGTAPEIEKIVQTNFLSNIWTCRAFLKGMIERKKGHVVCIASASTIHPMPGATIYTGTKWGVAGLMAALEEELRGEGHGNYLKFTTVYPYFVSTRKDLMKSINLRFPAITAQETAKVAVAAMLKNEKDVAVPTYLYFLSKFSKNFTAEVQQLIRDKIFRERDVLVRRYKESK
ncbi:estradiol 17-beta-dehydrogenase 11-like [Lutzomyia longipalpis]|uniref:Short-chain dehydrogenase/reductase 3 n=1 Tax=Lutzomyia longipalpis TaxID=7200 RepID=A0A7G3A9T2_LUTLO|nr:estradiol 17-beta-dehydrogenase 11-like [Lutzomyia longipalpis]